MIVLDKKVFVTRSSLPPMEEYIREISDIWDTHWLTNMGEKHQKLQEELKEYLGVYDVDLLTNGHMALELSLQALGLTSGEVITTPFTFASTTHAIVRNGLNPVFCDINLTDFTMDVSKLEELITDKTVAILPVHVYGNICNIEEIDKIAKKYDLKVIYDAAHTFGEQYKGQGIGNFGDVSCFSFHATKVFNTIEGGAVCFHDKEFGDAIYRLKNFGIKNEDVVNGIGANAKMNEFCAAMGICNLKYVDSEISKRKIIVERYRDNLENIKGIQLNLIQKDVKSNYAYFPIVIHDEYFGTTRNQIAEELKKHGYYSRKYFYPLTNSFDCFHGKYNVDETPNARYISKRVLTLPLYPDLELQHVDEICDIIKKCKSDKQQ